VSIENELGVSAATLKTTPTSLFPNPDDYFNLVADALKLGDPRKALTNRGWMTLSDTFAWPWSGHDHYGIPAPNLDRDFNEACSKLMTALNCSHVTTAIRMSLAIVQAIEGETGRMRGHIHVRYQTTESCHFLSYACDTCNTKATYLQKSDLVMVKPCPIHGCTGTLSQAVLAFYECGAGHQLAYSERLPYGSAVGQNCTAPGCVQTLTKCTSAQWSLWSLHPKRGDKTYEGTPSPSCGFPVGVFWTFIGDTTLWAHEIGHNRHYEHAADAQQKAGARTGHDKEDNAFIIHGDEKAENKGWDRACLMSYVGQVADTKGTPTYDKVRDLPCFCFKCVLKNRGWALDGLDSPPGDLQDEAGV
jgi:hypothetical protein